MTARALARIGHDVAGRIATITHNFANTAANLGWTFAYNPAGQVISRTASNDSYTFHPGVQAQTYVTNGLNQYTSVSGTAFSYDTSGNLTSDGVRTFGYDIDNHMISGTAQVALQNGFSPLGRRLWAEAAGQSAPTYFVYDGEDISGGLSVVCTNGGGAWGFGVMMEPDVCSLIGGLPGNSIGNPGAATGSAQAPSQATAGNTRLQCVGTARFSAVGPLPQAPGDSAYNPGVKPWNGSVAINPGVFGFSTKSEMREYGSQIQILPHRAVGWWNLTND